MITFFPESPVFEVGKKESLQCTIDSDVENIKKVFWYRNAVLLRSSEKYTVENSNLTILSFQSADAGRYVCKIKIGSSYIRRKVYVEVKNGKILIS